MSTPKNLHFKRNIGIAVLVTVIILIGIVAGFTSGFFNAGIDGSTPAPTTLLGEQLQTSTPQPNLTPTPTPLQTTEPNQTVSEDNNITALSAVTNGFQLSIALMADKTTFAVGEEVEITFEITNVSNQTLNFINQNGDSNFNFQVYNSTNNAVYMWELGAYPLNDVNVTLAPNQSYTRNLIWTQESDMTPPIPPLNQVPSGAYYIIGELGYANPYPIQTTPPNFQTAPLNITISNL